MCLVVPAGESLEEVHQRPNIPGIVVREVRYGPVQRRTGGLHMAGARISHSHTGRWTQGDLRITTEEAVEAQVCLLYTSDAADDLTTV